jgi:ABC-type polysaccharide/polyol phosphate transport system ATPase subunit
MSLPAIEVSGLSKRYVIRHESRHDNLRDTLHHTARSVWRKLRWGTGFSTEEFWALRDVSFSVQPGEVVGIIGRNGAGKSTLLKILSRITEPTTGRVTIRGRVASLLEVGTGFHPELSGRENIFLNGAILGMSRAEIRKKFDEIVAFAEVERFLDTPVKRYSSGMYVRLAFAVAAHLEPEILIVDEVLAVGDAQFQKKCLQRMQKVARGGRTVLFVSHSMGAVRDLCPACLCLKAGKTEGFGPTPLILSNYLEVPNRHRWIREAPSNSRVYIESASAEPEPQTGHVLVRMRIRAKSMVRFSVQVRLKDASGNAAAFAIAGAAELYRLDPGSHVRIWRMDCSTLAIGRYSLTMRLTIPGQETFDCAEDCLSLDFVAPPPVGAARRIEQGWGVGNVMLPLIDEPEGFTTDAFGHEEPGRENHV